MPRIVWTQTHWPKSGEQIPEPLGHGMNVEPAEVDKVLAELRALPYIADAHVVTLEEASEAWRTHPARKVNGGRLDDAALLSRLGAQPS